MANSILRRFSAWRSSTLENDVGEGDLGQLGDAVHKQRDLRAELLADLVDADGGVLGHIVHEGGRHALAVHAELDQDARDAERVADIRFAAAAELAFVRGGGQGIGAVYQLKVIRAAAVDHVLFELLIGNGHRLPVFHSASSPFVFPIQPCAAMACSFCSTGASSRLRLAVTWAGTQRPS